MFEVWLGSPSMKTSIISPLHHLPYGSPSPHLLSHLKISLSDTTTAFYHHLFLLNIVYPRPPCISFARPDSLQLRIRAGKSLSETLTLEGLPPQVLKCKMFSKPKRNPTHAICQLVIMALIPFLNFFVCGNFPMEN